MIYILHLIVIYLQIVNVHSVINVHNVINVRGMHSNGDCYLALDKSKCDDVCCEDSSNYVIFRGKITKEKADKFADCADIFMANRHKLDINQLHIYIDSHGGDSKATDKMVNTIEYMNNRNVKTFCYSGSMIASGASYVFFSCNFRSTKINTQFVLHHAVYADVNIWKRSYAENKFNKLDLDSFNQLGYYQYLKMSNVKLYEPFDINVCEKMIVFQCISSHSAREKNRGNYLEITQNEIKKIFDLGIINTSYDMLKLGLIDIIYLYY
jgi:hypothetical protein